MNKWTLDGQWYRWLVDQFAQLAVLLVVASTSVVQCHHFYTFVALNQLHQCDQCTSSTSVAAAPMYLLHQCSSCTSRQLALLPVTQGAQGSFSH